MSGLPLEAAPMRWGKAFAASGRMLGNRQFSSQGPGVVLWLIVVPVLVPAVIALGALR